MPQNKTVDEQKRGPNLGYRPYWYGYNFANDLHPKQTIEQQSSHEEWDYGLGRGSGAGVWGGGGLALLARDDNVLGAASLVGRDIRQFMPRPCHPNLGPDCVLGPPADAYKDTMPALLNKTKFCDQCSEQNKKVGLVCAMDPVDLVQQEMDYCVMLKMNCLGGIASTHWDVKDTYWLGNYPYAMKPGWARVSVRAPTSVHIMLFQGLPIDNSINGQLFHWACLHCLSRVTWRNMTIMWNDGIPVTGPNYNTSGVLGGDDWMEYTVVWKKISGWFLMSQARQRDWESRFHINHTSRRISRDYNYITVSGDWNNNQTFIIHDLKLVNKGKCGPPKMRDDFPTDTEEVNERTRDVEREFHERVQAAGVRPEDWYAEDAPYIEYPHV